MKFLLTKDSQEKPKPQTGRKYTLYIYLPKDPAENT